MRIAIAGLGFMGATHLRAFQSVPDAEVVAVISSDAEKLTGNLAGIQGNLGATFEPMDFSHLRKYRTLDEALRDSKIDAFDICLPTDQHFPTALAALRADKDVLVEKPLSLDGDSADTLVMEAKRRGRILMAGHVLRFIPAYEALRAILAEGTLGPVRSAFFRRRCGAPGWSRWLTEPARSGGATLDLLIHDIDFCLHLFGKPKLISALGFHSPERSVDVMDARLIYEWDTPVLITGGWHHPKAYPFSMEFTVICDAGTLEFDSAGTPLTLFTAAGTADPVSVGTEVDPFVQELRYFTECVRSRREPARCLPSESALAVKLANCLIESRSRNGVSMPCPS